MHATTSSSAAPLRRDRRPTAATGGSPSRPGSVRLVGIALSLLAAGCAASNGAATDVQRTEAPDDTTVAVVAGTPATAVGVVADGCSLVSQLGSGIPIATGDDTTHGLIATSAHTLAGATSVEVVDRDGERHDGIVVGFDPDADLALVRVADEVGPPVPLAVRSTTGPARLLVWQGDDGVAERDVEIMGRLDVTIEDIYTDEVVNRAGLEVAGLVEGGDSGAAVLDAAGGVVGIVYANSRDRGGVGFATDVSELKALLASVDDDAVDNGRCV